MEGKGRIRSVCGWSLEASLAPDGDALNYSRSDNLKSGAHLYGLVNN